MKLRRTGQTDGAHARRGTPGRLRRLTVTTLALATTTGGGLAAYALTASTPASAHTVARAPADPPLLRITKAASVVGGGANRVITYTYTVRSPINGAFLNVSVGDTMRIGTARVRRFICTIGNMPRGATRICRFKIRTAARVTDTATVFAGPHGVASGMSNTVIVPVTG